MGGDNPRMKRRWNAVTAVRTGIYPHGGHEWEQRESMTSGVQPVFETYKYTGGVLSCVGLGIAGTLSRTSSSLHHRASQAPPVPGTFHNLPVGLTGSF